MGQPKLTPLAAAIRAAEQLSDEEKQTLRDVLRPAPKPRQKGKGGSGKTAQKRSASSAAKPVAVGSGKEPCGVLGCGKPLDDNVHQLASVHGYHEFVEPAGEAKGASV